MVLDSLYFRWNHIQAILMMVLMILARCCLKFSNDKTTGQMFQRIIVLAFYKERHNLIHWLLFLVRGNNFHYIISLSLLLSSLLPIRKYSQSYFLLLVRVLMSTTWGPVSVSPYIWGWLYLPWNATTCFNFDPKWSKSKLGQQDS